MPANLAQMGRTNRITVKAAIVRAGSLVRARLSSGVGVSLDSAGIRSRRRSPGDQNPGSPSFERVAVAVTRMAVRAGG